MNRTSVFRCAIALACLSAFTPAAQAYQLGGEVAEDPDVHPEAALSGGEEQNADGAIPRDLCICVGESKSPIVAKIERALSEPLQSAGLDFTEIPLEQVVALIQEEYKLPVYLNKPALDAIGLSVDAPVTGSLRDISLKSALNVMLNELQLVYVIQNEMLIITTPEEAEMHLRTCVYDVRDLLPDTSNRSTDALIDTIVSCIATETWAENGGGEAEIRPLKPGSLVISQTQPIHDQIRDLLAAVRSIDRATPASAKLDSAANADQAVTRSYVLQVDRGEKVEQFRHDVRNLIVQSMPDTRWTGQLEDGQPVVLSVLPDRIVARHLPAVQDKVEELLRESGIATPSDEQVVRGGGGGGGIFQPNPQLRKGSLGMFRGEISGRGGGFAEFDQAATE
jgi:hypothetical protein